MLDEGIGVTPEECLAAFERHYRGKQARLMRPEGAGLDLSIAQAIVAAHDGEIILRSNAERNPVPILMLTAMGTVQDRVTGLRRGADDYLTKPFAFDELLARIESLMRRPTELKLRPEAAPLAVGPLVFDLDKLQVQRSGVDVALTARELALLELLMSAPGRMFSRERILSNVWGSREDSLTNVVDVYMLRLRAKIDEEGQASLIQTARGLGYKIQAVT